MDYTFDKYEEEYKASQSSQATLSVGGLTRLRGRIEKLEGDVGSLNSKLQGIETYLLNQAVAELGDLV